MTHQQKQFCSLRMIGTGGYFGVPKSRSIHKNVPRMGTVMGHMSVFVYVEHCWTISIKTCFFKTSLLDGSGIWWPSSGPEDSLSTFRHYWLVVVSGFAFRVAARVDRGNPYHKLSTDKLLFPPGRRFVWVVPLPGKISTKISDFLSSWGFWPQLVWLYSCQVND